MLFFTNLITIKILLSFIVFLILPGYFIYASTSLKKIIPENNFNLPLYFVISLASFMPLYTYLSFTETKWELALKYFYINYIIYFILYLFKGSELKINLPKIKYWPYFILVIIALAGNHYFDFYQDSIYHLYRIKYLNISDVVTNQVATTFENAIESISKHNLNYITAKNISWPTYDFSFYYALLVTLIKITKSKSYQFIFLFNNFLFINLILAPLLLARRILKKEKFIQLLFLCLILSHIVFKNYFYNIKIGSPAYNFICLYHPTNIAIFILCPMALFIFIAFNSSIKNKRTEFFKYIIFTFLLATSFMIHKISFIILSAFFFSFILFKLIYEKKLNIRIILYSLTPIILSAVYLIYYLFIPKIYNVAKGAITNASLMESRERALVQYNSSFDFIVKYASYIENTGYKLLFFPTTLIPLLFIFLIYDRKKINSKIGYFITISIVSFFLFQLPGMNYLVIKLMRAFIQRMITVLNPEIILAFIIYVIMVKMKKNLLTPLLVITTLCLTLTVTFDYFRKGNQKLIYNSHRIDFIEYVNKNLKNNFFISDFNTEHEMNGVGEKLSPFFNYNQSNIHRVSKDYYNFHERINRFIYRNEDNNLFTEELINKNIHYIIISKNNYFDGTFENFKPNLFNPDFKTIYQNKNASIVFEDDFHIIYKI